MHPTPRRRCSDLNRHEIPTHLNVEDKAIAGLTMRQLMTVAIGLGLSYGAANQLPLPMPVPAVLGALIMAAIAVAALWRPGGRPMEDWAFVLLRYWAIPRVAVWRVRRSDPSQRRKDQTYEVVLPDSAWTTTVTEERSDGR
ncbi:MAG: hypothetical protein GEU75_06390 [Dehalococcoidia bacterium]|nr:hypothetical protein [Dehalococcoidia bacterium]